MVCTGLEGPEGWTRLLGSSTLFLRLTLDFEGEKCEPITTSHSIQLTPRVASSLSVKHLTLCAHAGFNDYFSCTRGCFSALSSRVDDYEKGC